MKSPNLHKDIYSHESVISRFKLQNDLRKSRSAIKRKFTNTFKNIANYFDLEEKTLDGPENSLTTLSSNQNMKHEKFDLSRKNA